jgi:heavy metal sensor kinase
MTLRFQTRLIFFCAATFAALLTGFGAASYHLLARQLDRDARADLMELTNGLHGYLQFTNGAPSVAFNAKDPDQATFVHEATRYYQIYDADDGRLLVESPGVEPLGLHLTPAEVHAYEHDPKLYDVQTAYGRMRMSSSLIAPVSGRHYLLQVGETLDPMDDALRSYLQLLMWWALPSLAVVALAVWWMARRAVAPLTALAVDAGRVSIATLNHRLATRGSGDQLDKVAEAFNDTLARLEGAVGDMRQFSSALAHELRTPLTSLRGELELSLRSPSADAELKTRVASQIEEIDRLTRLINQLLTLARAESGEIQLARDVVDLAALARTVTEQLEPIARAKDLDLLCEADQPVPIMGDRGWLERCLLNLLDNALKYTPAGGTVQVLVSREGGVAVVTVSDTGVGMSSDVIPHVFERFYQGDPARSSSVEGAGLGLSLVKCIVDRHSGRIGVRSSPGDGSMFTITLAAADP